MLRKLVALAVLCVAGMASIPAQAQSFSIVELPGGCGTGNITSNSLSYLTVDSGLKLCVNATATLGGFTATATGTPISVTTGGVSGTLPAGAEVVATNVGTTNGAYCALGASATTSSQYIAPNGGWFAFAVGASTQLTCITSTSTTTVNTTGGSGLPTGTGGGGGGSSANASVSATGSSVPASATYMGMIVSGNLTGIPGTANGLKTDGSAVTQPVSGTFWQATQPVSGTFWQTTQPVSGTVAASNFPTTVDVNTGNAGASTIRTVTAANDPLLTSASTCLAGTAFNTNTPITTGVVGGITCTVNGNLYVSFSGTPTIANGNGVVPTQGGAVLSATNGMFDNLLQGNAVLSATNGLYANILQGNAALSATNGTYGNILQGNAALTATNTLFSAISTGGNTAAVKAASTPSPATDPSLSVTINAGSNGLITTGGSTTANSVPTNSNSQYPVNSVTTAPTPLVAKGTGTTGAVTGTLTPGATATAYVCGFNVSYVGGTAQVGPLVLSGLLGGSFTYQIPVATATGGQTFTQTFTPCIPASTTNTAIVMTTVADGTASAVDVNIWGYGL